MTKTLKELREEARACQDCPLWANATQTVLKEEEEKEAAFAQLVKDLKLINKALDRP